MSEHFRPVRGIEALWRGAFGVEHGGHRWVVGVDFLDWDERVRLYRDGIPVDEQRTRASFELGDGARLEARVGTYGMRYVRVVDDEGARDVAPLPGTAEAWRDRMDREHPDASRAADTLSWVVLAVALLTQVPQLLQLVTGLLGHEPWFVLDLPPTVNTVLTVLGLAAALDRGLRRRHHPIIDA
ncbi:hypothetical protein [Oerskovia flava]|uniref:hypothetical protein n=1 Tax=Oerskovia flava TaxID=2986422 RepID=UPI00223F14CE|nr:hypothetical protein [Oerskovia sp. JB1-3-2]